MSAGDEAPITAAWLRDLPKAEVHVHLEGCIPAPVLLDAARAAGQAVPDDPDELYEFTDLASLLRFLDWACALVTEPAQLTEIAYAFARRMVDDGVRYADVILNPTHWPAWRPRLGDLVAALDHGFAEAEADGLPPVGLCLSIKRNQPRSAAVELAEWIVEARPPRVVGLSIDGNEAAEGRTSARFADAFRTAARHGLHRCVHAGESSGPDGVRDALTHLHAERIDHGVRAIEDPGLVAELAARGVPLDVCPTSNITLGVAESLDAHPVEALRHAGVRVSLNTDDPLLFGCDVVGEYARCAETFGWTRADAAAVAQTSIEAAFCDDERRKALLAQLAAYLAGRPVPG